MNVVKLDYNVCRNIEGRNYNINELYRIRDMLEDGVDKQRKTFILISLIVSVVESLMFILIGFNIGINEVFWYTFGMLTMLTGFLFLLYYYIGVDSIKSRYNNALSKGYPEYVETDVEIR